MVIYMKCFNCGKELDSSPSTLSLFCSDKCAKQFDRDFNAYIKSLDVKIPDALLSDTKDK